MAPIKAPAGILNFEPKKAPGVPTIKKMGRWKKVFIWFPWAEREMNGDVSMPLTLPRQAKGFYAHRCLDIMGFADLSLRLD